MPFCENCQTEVKKDDRFCSVCGFSMIKAKSQKPEHDESPLSKIITSPLFLFSLGIVIIAGLLSLIMLFFGNKLNTGNDLNIPVEGELNTNIELKSETELQFEADQLSDNRVYVSIEPLELRDATDIEADVISKLAFGDQLEVLSNEGDWVNVVTSGGEEGWLPGDYVVGAKEYQGRYQGIDLTNANYFGNSMSNTLHGGMIAMQGDWIYFINRHDGNSIYKLYVDGSKLTKLNSDKSFGLNVTGNWIFYTNESEGYKIYRIDTDGKERTEVNDDWSIGLQVVGNWIYYVNVGEYRKIYKIRTDGSERRRLSNDDSLEMNVCGDWIYYTTLQEQDSIFRIGSDGNSRSLVHKADTIIYGSIFVDNGWVYYSDTYDNSLPNNIYKVRIDGSELTKLGKDRGWRLNISGDYIYYRNISDSAKVYRMHTDGSGRQKVSDDSPFETYVVGDWLFYYQDNGELYRMRTDGSEKHLVY